MPRPKTKQELLTLSDNRYRGLLDCIASLNEIDRNKEFPMGYLNRNSPNVLAYLHHWHLMFLDWYTVGMSRKKPNMPGKGYTWKTIPELNRTIWQKYKDVNYPNVKRLLNSSFSEIQSRIEKHTDEELFEKKRYKWTGSTSLGSYLVSATSSHYDWAYKLIKSATNIR